MQACGPSLLFKIDSQYWRYRSSTFIVMLLCTVGLNSYLKKPASEAWPLEILWFSLLRFEFFSCLHHYLNMLMVYFLLFLSCIQIFHNLCFLFIFQYSWPQVLCNINNSYWSSICVNSNLEALPHAVCHRQH